MAVAASQPASGLRGRIESLGTRWRALGWALAVHHRFNAVHGSNLAASVAMQAFLSLFPLMLVVVAAVGFFSATNGHGVAVRIVSELGLTGEAATTILSAIEAAEDSRRVASILGLAGLLWSGLGLVGALQYAYNQVWGVDQRGWKDRAVGLAWLAGAAVLFVAGAGATAALNFVPSLFAPLGIVVGLAVNFALWLWTGRVLPNRVLSWRQLVPGAVVGAVGLEVLKLVGGVVVPRAVASSSQLYGSIGVVFAAMAWLIVFSQLVVYSECVNAVAYARQRAALIDITDGDEVAAAVAEVRSRPHDVGANIDRAVAPADSTRG